MTKTKRLLVVVDRIKPYWSKLLQQFYRTANRLTSIRRPPPSSSSVTFHSTRRFGPWRVIFSSRVGLLVLMACAWILCFLFTVVRTIQQQYMYAPEFPFRQGSQEFVSVNFGRPNSNNDNANNKHKKPNETGHPKTLLALQKARESQLQASKHATKALSRQKRQESPRFLIFEGDQLKGQGAGNLMNGLLAAHLLGEEFGRIVCVTPAYQDFHVAFQAVDPLAVTFCPRFFPTHAATYKQLAADDEHVAFLSIVNFQNPPSNECELKERLSRQSIHAIIYLRANTYPRWPRVPPNYFFQYYKVKPEVLQWLPYDILHPPKTVVHLRHSDAFGDSRTGLDDASLQALGEYSLATTQQQQQHESPPYLITNHVPWFDMFEQRYGWHHPDWQTVWHSALRETWGERNTTTTHHTKGNVVVDLGKEWNLRKFGRPNAQDRVQTLQLWADWVTLLTASKVYYTHSDFSLSAIHWMGEYNNNNQGIVDKDTNNTKLVERSGNTSPVVHSWTINGLDQATGQLVLDEEYWRKDGPAPRLVDRQGDGLFHCDNHQ